MPPKVKFTKEQIIDTAFNLVEQQGIDALTARNLGKELGCSSAPIFTAFDNMEEVQLSVAKKAFALYSDYIAEGLKDAIPFKGSGRAYVRFAIDHPLLFRFLFMSKGNGETTHYLPSGDENSPAILAVIMNSYDISEEDAKRLYNHLSIYTYGLGVLFAQGNVTFTFEDADRMLSEMFLSVIKEITGKPFGKQ